MHTKPNRVTIGGVTYSLVLDFNAMAEFEGIAGKDAFDMLEELEKGRASVRDMRAMFWAMFQEHHPEVTLKQAGKLMAQDMGALAQTVKMAMPKAKPDDVPDAQPIEADPGNAPAAMKDG